MSCRRLTDLEKRRLFALVDWSLLRRFFARGYVLGGLSCAQLLGGLPVTCLEIYVNIQRKPKCQCAQLSEPALDGDSGAASCLEAWADSSGICDLVEMKPPEQFALRWGDSSPKRVSMIHFETETFDSLCSLLREQHLDWTQCAIFADAASSSALHSADELWLGKTTAAEMAHGSKKVHLVNDARLWSKECCNQVFTLQRLGIDVATVRKVLEGVDKKLVERRTQCEALSQWAAVFDSRDAATVHDLDDRPIKPNRWLPAKQVSPQRQKAVNKLEMLALMTQLVEALEPDQESRPVAATVRDLFQEEVGAWARVAEERKGPTTDGAGEPVKCLVGQSNGQSGGSKKRGKRKRENKTGRIARLDLMAPDVRAQHLMILSYVDGEVKELSGTVEPDAILLKWNGVPCRWLQLDCLPSGALLLQSNVPVACLWKGSAVVSFRTNCFELVCPGQGLGSRDEVAVLVLRNGAEEAEGQVLSCSSMSLVRTAALRIQEQESKEERKAPETEEREVERREVERREVERREEEKKEKEKESKEESKEERKEKESKEKRPDPALSRPLWQACAVDPNRGLVGWAADSDVLEPLELKLRGWGLIEECPVIHWTAKAFLLRTASPENQLYKVSRGEDGVKLTPLRVPWPVNGDDGSVLYQHPYVLWTEHSKTKNSGALFEEIQENVFVQVAHLPLPPSSCLAKTYAIAVIPKKSILLFHGESGLLFVATEPDQWELVAKRELLIRLKACERFGDTWWFTTSKGVFSLSPYGALRLRVVGDYVTRLSAWGAADEDSEHPVLVYRAAE